MEIKQINKTLLNTAYAITKKLNKLYDKAPFEDIGVKALPNQYEIDSICSVLNLIIKKATYEQSTALESGVYTLLWQSVCRNYTFAHVVETLISRGCVLING